MCVFAYIFVLYIFFSNPTFFLFILLTFPFILFLYIICFDIINRNHLQVRLFTIIEAKVSLKLTAGYPDVCEK